MTSIMDRFRLDGRVALVTGAAGHLGRAFSSTLAQLGAEVVLTDRAGAPLDELAQTLSDAHGVAAHAIPCDLEDADARAGLVATAGERFASIDVLVNNAAFVGTSELQGWAEPLARQSTETWRRAVEVNLTAAFDLCRDLAPRMAAGGRGSVVNIASIYGVVGPDWSLYEGTSMANPAAYGASKAGLIHLTKYLSTALAPEIRVNAITPGGIARGQASAFVERYEAKTPLGRMATEDDLCGALAYLASDASAYVTGTNLIVDGGWCAV